MTIMGCCEEYGKWLNRLKTKYTTELERKSEEMGKEKDTPKIYVQNYRNLEVIRKNIRGNPKNG